jgi:hypothetical protein
MDLKDAAIHLTLPVETDTWFTEWSSEDDKNILTSGNKTFALEYLIRGVKEAYDTQNKNYIDFSIHLSK